MSKKILVVDDEPFILKSVSFIMKREGYEVKEATNGVEALQVIREWCPDVVFLDIMMPKKNGYEVCREIKSDPFLKGTYIIMLTAKGQVTDESQGFEVGADDYLTKPFSPLLLLEKMKAIFSGSKTA